MGGRGRRRLILVAIIGVLVCLVGYRFRLILLAKPASRLPPAQRVVTKSNLHPRICRSDEEPPQRTASSGPAACSLIAPVYAVQHGSTLLLWIGLPGLLAAPDLRKRVFKKS